MKLILPKLIDLVEKYPSYRQKPEFRKYNHRNGYRLPVQARNRLLRYDVNRFSQIKSFILDLITEHKLGGIIHEIHKNHNVNYFGVLFNGRGLHDSTNYGKVTI